MYLRFVTKELDEVSRRPKGVFAAAYELLDSGALDSHEWRILREVLDWFNVNLPHPPKVFAASRAIFWFDSRAKDCIDRIWDLVWLLREHGHAVDVYRCPRLANVKYRDRLQVAAYPSDSDEKITVQ